MDRSINRREKMEKLFNQYELKQTRISAIDASLQNGEFHTKCIPNPRITKLENACTYSHIKAMKYFIENMTDDRVIIFEDDIGFDFLNLIPFDWSELEAILPQNYGIIQLAITLDRNRIVGSQLIKTTPEMKYYCSTAYLIKRDTAQKMIDRYYNNDKYDMSKETYVTADSMIASSDATFSIPIFTYQTVESTIHPSNLHIHSRSKMQQLRMWVYTKRNFNKHLYFASFPK